jgi:hypothetical protein
MILRLAAGAALLITLIGAPAGACPPPSDNLLFHSCWGEARLALALLPEDLPLQAPDGASQRVVVTGAYTGRETRGEGLPTPVGLFVRDGTVVNRNLGRMDGVLLVDPKTGQPELHHRHRVAFAGKRFDLNDLGQRRDFIAAAAAAGISVMQSHLLIVDGTVDVREQEGAPVFTRRMLFTDSHGFGLYQTGWAMTLYDAAQELAEALSPQMVLNLDMGSYDYCQRFVAGSESACGALDRGNTAKLSNLLILIVQ